MSRRGFLTAMSCALALTPKSRLPRTFVPAAAIRRSSLLPPAAHWSRPAARASATAHFRRGRILMFANAASSPSGMLPARKRLFRWETFGDFTKLAFSPDGKLLAACRLFATDDGIEFDEVRLWDVTTGRLVNALDRCHAFDFSPDSRQLAVLSRSKCVVYDLKTGKEKQVKPLGDAITIVFSADGLSLIGIVRDESKYRLRSVSLESGEANRQSLSLDQPFYSIAVAADGSLLATGHEGGNVVLWDAQTLDVKSRLQTGVRGLAHPFFSPDAKLLAAGCQETGDVVIWNLADRQRDCPLHLRKRRPAYLLQPPGQCDRSAPSAIPRAFAFRPTANRSSSALRRHPPRDQWRPGARGSAVIDVGQTFSSAIR